jgi:hypothetical protein
MKAEITFDIVMDDDSSFAEGCYRLEGGSWEVFIFWKSNDAHSEKMVKKDLVWDSNVRGINVILPADTKLNKALVIETLSEVFGETQWSEVRGPDSMQLR